MLKVDGVALQNALAFMGTICLRKAHIGVFECVRLTVVNDKLEIKGLSYDKRGGITVNLIEPDDGFDCVVSLHDLAAVVGVYRRGGLPINLRLTKSKLMVEDGVGGKIPLAILNVSDFPNVERGVPYSGGVLDPHDIVSRLKLGSFASDSSMNDKFKNIHIMSRDNRVLFEATDRFAAAMGTLEVSTEVKPLDVVVDSSIVSPLNKMLGSAGEDEMWDFCKLDDDTFLIGAERWFIRCSLFDLGTSSYPCINELMRNEQKNVLVLDKADFLYTLEKSTAVSEDKSVVIAITDGVVTISNTNEAEHRLSAVYEGQADNEIRVDAQYLHKVMHGIPTDESEFKLELGTKFEPLIFRAEDTSFIVMPLVDR
ncbi:MAG: hypothetical protein CSB13_06600 [Chloroflexi bacterium]|nr:MAG: hypothetical protein CSB13_06600 [Chloroflexota bacterium]